MVSISKESAAETDARLQRVIAQATVQFYHEIHTFEEFPLSEFIAKADQQALAIVRDDQVWSQLVPRAIPGAEPFAVWRFHFPEGVDNSGFVGWLASRLKSRFGTGVFVICGSNSRDGGIFDYWGCPTSLHDQIFAEIRDLVDPK